MIERDIQSRIRLALARLGSTIFRQNVGLGWVGRLIRRESGRVLLENARPLHAGLCEGSSDLIGWTPVLVTQEWMGRQIAVFTAIEVKTKSGRISDAQENFLDQVKKAGGIAIIARSEEDATGGVSEWLKPT